MSVRGFENRVRRLGSIEKAQALGPRCGSTQANTVRNAAAILGISERAVRKSAQKRGVSVREDLLRRAMEGGDEALAKMRVILARPRTHVRRAS